MTKSVLDVCHLISRTSLRLLHSASQLVVVLEEEEVEVEDFEETASSNWRCRASLSFLPDDDGIRVIR